MKYGVNYGSKVNLAEIAGYDLVVLEPEQYTRHEIRTLNQSETQIIGYISMSEVNPHRWYYSKLEEIGFLGINENWNSPYINLADSAARSVLLDEVAGSIMDMGFDGLLLDTIDGVAPYSERGHLQDEMLSMIKELDRRYPDAYIIQNRGIFLLSKSHNYIDAVMVEDIATRYNFENQQYSLRDEQNYKEHVEWLRSFADTLEKPVLLLDYAIQDTMRNKTIQRLDTLNQPYFISNIGLDSLPRVSDIYQ